VGREGGVVEIDATERTFKNFHSARGGRRDVFVPILLP
jgi:hypothetical protein